MPRPKKIFVGKSQYAIVDSEDYEFLMQRKWYLASGYAQAMDYDKGKRTKVLMHRLLLNAPKHLQVDHINHDPLDNRKANIRLATRSQNQWNKRVSKISTTGYKAISFEANKYRVRIKKNRKAYDGGSYANLEDAIRAHAVLASRLHGEFASSKQFATA